MAGHPNSATAIARQPIYSVPTQGEESCTDLGASLQLLVCDTRAWFELRKYEVPIVSVVAPF